MGALSHRPLIAAALALALGACGGGPKPAPATPPSITLSVTSATTCNHGRPLQAVIRTVTLQQFDEDQYRTIAQLVVSPDETVLTSFIVFPGVAQTIKLAPPAKGTAAVYFLFTDATGTSWKQQLDASATSQHVELADDQIAPPGSTAKTAK